MEGGGGELAKFPESALGAPALAAMMVSPARAGCEAKLGRAKLRGVGEDAGALVWATSTMVWGAGELGLATVRWVAPPSREASGSELGAAAGLAAGVA